MTEVVLGSYWRTVLRSSECEHATNAFVEALRKRAVLLYWSLFVLNTVLLWTAFITSLLPDPPLAGAAIPAAVGTAAHHWIAGEDRCNSRHAGEAENRTSDCPCVQRDRH